MPTASPCQRPRTCHGGSNQRLIGQNAATHAQPCGLGFGCPVGLHVRHRRDHLLRLVLLTALRSLRQTALRALPLRRLP
eukprot:5558235-Prymnesium_polylepis.1